MVEEFYVDLIIVVVDMEDVVKLEIDIVNVLFKYLYIKLKKKFCLCNSNNKYMWKIEWKKKFLRWMFNIYWYEVLKDM